MAQRSSYLRQAAAPEVTSPIVRAPSNDGDGIVIVGLQRFGWELLETNNEPNRGRYVEHIVFRVDQPSSAADMADPRADWRTQYNVTVGLVSPAITTAEADLHLWATAVAVVSSEGVSEDQTGVCMNTGHVAVGTVCEDDVWTLNCTAKGLPRQLQDSVVVDVPKPRCVK